MKISLFTPTHNTKFLPELWASIKNQDFYEWVIVYNNGAIPMDFKDPRVKTFTLDFAPEWVGPLKNYACAQCTGDVLLEMDHDDLLTPNAISEVDRAFTEHADCGFVYSNTIHSTGDFKPVQRFDERYGWKYRQVEFQGHTLDEHLHFEPTPNCVSRIWFAPNHLRAFRRDVYEQVGGYAKGMRILDDLDLMCRMYQVTKFHHIDKGLYVYRIHGENSWLKYNAEIQENVYRIHEQYIEDLATKWSKDNGLSAIELGGRIAAREGFTTVDLRDSDIVADLNEEWPFEDGSVGVVRAYDVFEHLKDPIHTMKELYRVLAPGGYALIQVPSTDGRGAFQDPTHVSFWNDNSFLYYTDIEKNKYIDCPVRFQSMRVYTTEKNPIGVCWTRAHLVKLGTERVPGEVKI
jgi:glycosyltransferase involved in cell wall biosynthesis